MFFNIRKYYILFIVGIATLLFLYSCAANKSKQITIQEKYFEEFQKKKVRSGHYGGYFILDGDKRIYKLHLSDREEIIVESDFEEGQVVYSGRDFYKNMVILFNGDDVFRVVKGDLNIYKEKDKLEAKIDVMGIKDMWELVADSIPRIEDGNHHNVVFEGVIEIKKQDE